MKSCNDSFCKDRINKLEEALYLWRVLNSHKDIVSLIISNPDFRFSDDYSLLFSKALLLTQELLDSGNKNE